MCIFASATMSIGPTMPSMMSRIIAVERGRDLHRIAMQPDQCGIGIGLEELLEAETVEALQHPEFLRASVLEGLEHHLVDAVLRGAIGRQAHRQVLHRHAPPGRRRHHPEIEGPGAFVLRQAVAQHVVVRMAMQPFSHLGVDLAPFLVGQVPCGDRRPQQFPAAATGASLPRSAAPAHRDRPTSARASRWCLIAARRWRTSGGRSLPQPADSA